MGFLKSSMDIKIEKEGTAPPAIIETTEVEPTTPISSLYNAVNFPLPLVAGSAAAGVVVVSVIIIAIILCKRKHAMTTSFRTNATEYPEPFAGSSNFFLSPEQDDQTTFGAVPSGAEEAGSAAGEVPWRHRSQTGPGGLSDSANDANLSDSADDPYDLPSQSVVLRPKELATTSAAASMDPDRQQDDQKTLAGQRLKRNVDKTSGYSRQPSENEAIYDVPKTPIKRTAHDTTLVWTRENRTSAQKSSQFKKSSQLSVSGAVYDVPRSAKAISPPVTKR